MNRKRLTPIKPARSIGKSKLGGNFLSFRYAGIARELRLNFWFAVSNSVSGSKAPESGIRLNIYSDRCMT
jgi:hypothetical protein